MVQIMMKELLAKAISIASEAHVDQIDKSGEPYILHPLRVMQRCSPPNCHQNDELRIIAVLHDTVEDNESITLESLSQEGFNETIINGIDSITKRNNEKYSEFIERSARNTLGVIVKMKDIEDNLCPWRMSKLNVRDVQSLIERYRKAQFRLNVPYYDACMNIFGKLI